MGERAELLKGTTTGDVEERRREGADDTAALATLGLELWGTFSSS